MTTYQAFCEDSFDGDFSQQLKKGLDELLIVKLWKKGATTEVGMVMMLMEAFQQIPNRHRCDFCNVWTRTLLPIVRKCASSLISRKYLLKLGEN